MIKRNSANLFSFLSPLDNLFIWAHFTSCRQTYFPMDRPNPSSKVHTCAHPSFTTALQIHIVTSLCYFGVYTAKLSIHRCTHIRCTCLLPHTSLVFYIVSVVTGTQRTLTRTSPSKEVCDFTETQFTSTYILKFNPFVNKSWFLMRIQNIS